MMATRCRNAAPLPSVLRLSVDRRGVDDDERPSFSFKGRRRLDLWLNEFIAAH